MRDPHEPAGTGSQLRELLRIVEARYGLLCFSILAALGAALFEGLSLALLVPTFQGILDGGFGRVRLLTIDSARILPEWVQADNKAFGGLLLCAILVCVVLKLSLKYVSDVTALYQVRALQHKLRMRVFARFLSFGKLYFDRKNAGELHLLMNTYTAGIASIPSRAQSTFFLLAALCIYVVMLAWISWRLTAGVLLALPILHYSLKTLIDRIRIAAQTLSDRATSMSRQLNNALNFIPFVKLSSREADELSLFSALSETVRAADCSIERKTSLIGPLNELVVTCFIFVLVLGLALWYRGADKTEIAKFAVFIFTLRRASFSMGAINSLRGTFAELSAQVTQVLEVFNDHEKYLMPDGSQPFTQLQHGIEIKDLTFCYPPARAALCRVSFSLAKGRMTAVVGRTGSGKSTLLSLLVRLYDPPPGTILVDGVDLRTLQVKSWRARTALVTQDVYLFNGSFRDNLSYGLDYPVSDQRLMEVLELTQLAGLVANLPFGLDTEIGDRGVRLSGGEKQRLAIGRALLKDPDVLILDEPTSALDSITERFIQEELEQLFLGKTVVLAAHRLATVRRANWVVVLDNGCVLEEGAIDDLLARRGAFFEYWQAQLMGHGHSAQPQPQIC